MKRQNSPDYFLPLMIFQCIDSALQHKQNREETNHVLSSKTNLIYELLYAKPNVLDKKKDETNINEIDVQNTQYKSAAHNVAGVKI